MRDGDSQYVWNSSRRDWPDSSELRIVWRLPRLDLVGRNPVHVPLFIANYNRVSVSTIAFDRFVDLCFNRGDHCVTLGDDECRIDIPRAFYWIVAHQTLSREILVQSVGC